MRERARRLVVILQALLLWVGCLFPPHIPTTVSLVLLVFPMLLFLLALDL